MAWVMADDGDYACHLQPLSEGYLAIAQPKQIEVAEIQASLLSKDEYAQFRAISAARAEVDASTEATATQTAAATATGDSTDEVATPTDATTASIATADTAVAIE
jgi:hypothetical protein